MKYHDNDVFFKFENLDLNQIGQFVGGNFHVTEHFMTPGQDPDWLNSHRAYLIDYTGRLTYRVGRKGSKETADWFNSRMHVNTFNHHAGKLNFAFLGKLELKFEVIKDGRVVNENTIEVPNVILAQGHAGGSNNWWIGSADPRSRHLESAPDNKLVLELIHSKYNRIECPAEINAWSPAKKSGMVVFARGGIKTRKAGISPNQIGVEIL